MDSRRVIRETKKLLGIPFCHYGRSSLGLDCSGLIYMSHHRSGINIPRNDGQSYPITWWKDKHQGERFLDMLLETGFEIVSDDKDFLALPGYIVVFRLFSKNAPVNHSGIMLNNSEFIHANASRRKNYSNVRKECLYPSYIKRFAYYLKHKDISYV